MKGVVLTVLPWLLLICISEGVSSQRVDCKWGEFGDWSECDGCTKTQTRIRPMEVFAQFGGNPCDGPRSETRPCVTTKSCPLDHGCGDRFRCRSGMCINRSLMCNGDQDCEEDNEDEQTCDRSEHFACDLSRPPPNIELLGVGVDIATGKSRGIVINTKSFGGQCRKIDSNAYRLPQSLLMYTFLTKVHNDLSDEQFNSEWHYAKDIVKRETVSGTTTGFRNYDYHETDERKRNFRLFVLKNDIEIATFQSNSPTYIPISEVFWKALSKLPTVYNYAAYREVLKQFGTHYISEGALGGSLNVIVRVDSESRVNKIIEIKQHNECEKTKRYFLIFPITHVSCDDDFKDLSRQPEVYSQSSSIGKVYTHGGNDGLGLQLEKMNVNTPDDNWRVYTDWADSVRSFPKVIHQKLRPLSELVKEVSCAGVKKLYLRRAIEQYLTESHPCNCRPCSNNGVVVMENNICQCIPNPDAAKSSTQQEIDGAWACWSIWSSCSGGRRSRSRTCTNPVPRNGGQHCSGESTETGECEDEQLQYLRNIEPECFDYTLPPKIKCGTPPALVNGYPLDPKDLYLVGGRVEYRCIAGFHLSGQSTLECTADMTWSGTLGVCQLSRCMMPQLAADVRISPDKFNYEIGDSVTLSCSEGKELQGEETVMCDPSLNFSPDPKEVKCQKVITEPDTKPNNSSLQCQVWEKEIRGHCVCKLPFECGSSLELCATNPVLEMSAVLTVCKMHALKCLKMEHTVAEDSICDWSVHTATAGCTKCDMWQTCDEQTQTCRCKDTSDCSTPGLSVCVRIGEDTAAAPQTLTECEAGLRRCKGETVTVVDIVPCST